jgi:hypothetical protein
MDQKMKNFDRAIEQRMNEQQVPPPFGAWNRIAAELDAMPMVAAEPAPVNSIVPKRAIASFIAGMLIMGSAVATGFWVKASLNRDNRLAGVSETAQPASFTVAAGNGINNLPALRLESNSPISKLPKYVDFSVPVTAKKSTSAPVSANTNNSLPLNVREDAPAPIQSVTSSAADLKETYYFPPVDIVTVEKCKTETEEPKLAKVEEPKATNDDDRPKADQKKFRPHRRRPGWAWGNINRM